MSEDIESKTVLVTGGTGFAGQHLVTELCRQGYQVHIVDRTRIAGSGEKKRSSNCINHLLDLTHPDGLRDLIQTINPRQVYHLAGRANVKTSWHGEAETYNANVIGAINLLAAIRETGQSPDVLIVSSGEVYGLVPEEDQPIDETRSPAPRSPYSASKYCQEIASRQMSTTMESKLVIARPFNHIGPGQRLGFVTADFAYQIARIEQGYQNPVIKVGNLDAQRDFTDVRDMVLGYVNALKSGVDGDVINICSTKSYRIRDFLDYFLELSKVQVKVELDPLRLRPADIPLLKGSHVKLTNLSQWKPTIDIFNTLEEILNYWRVQVKLESQRLE